MIQNSAVDELPVVVFDCGQHENAEHTHGADRTEVVEAEKERALQKVKHLDGPIREKIIRAIYTSNKGLMSDVVRRCSNEIFDKVTDHQGNGLIAMAVMLGDREMIKLLLKIGINPNHKNKEGNTALHYAIGLKRNECATWLLQEKEVREDIENNLGLTPWEL